MNRIRGAGVARRSVSSRTWAPLAIGAMALVGLVLYGNSDSSSVEISPDETLTKREEQQLRQVNQAAATITAELAAVENSIFMEQGSSSSTATNTTTIDLSPLLAAIAEAEEDETPSWLSEELQRVQQATTEDEKKSMVATIGARLKTPLEAARLAGDVTVLAPKVATELAKVFQYYGLEAFEV